MPKSFLALRGKWSAHVVIVCIVLISVGCVHTPEHNQITTQHKPFPERPDNACYAGDWMPYIHFPLDSSEILGDARESADTAFELVQKWPEYKLRVEGHTCDIGGDSYNLELGLRRAQAVANFLISKGVDSKRIQVDSMGELAPAVPNDSEKNRAYNRRVFVHSIYESKGD